MYQDTSFESFKNLQLSRNMKEILQKYFINKENFGERDEKRGKKYIWKIYKTNEYIFTYINVHRMKIVRIICNRKFKFTVKVGSTRKSIPHWRKHCRRETKKTNYLFHKSAMKNMVDDIKSQQNKNMWQFQFIYLCFIQNTTYGKLLIIH